VAKRPGIMSPLESSTSDFDWRKGWSESWRTAEGQAYLQTLHHWFVKPDPDGKFRISGVPPGEFDFAIALYGSTEGCLVHPVAQRVVRVTVAEGEASLELGKVEVPTQNVPQNGDMAPKLEFVSPDGNAADLEAIRG